MIIRYLDPQGIIVGYGVQGLAGGLSPQPTLNKLLAYEIPTETSLPVPWYITSGIGDQP